MTFEEILEKQCQALAGIARVEYENQNTDIDDAYIKYLSRNARDLLMTEKCRDTGGITVNARVISKSNSFLNIIDDEYFVVRYHPSEISRTSQCAEGIPWRDYSCSSFKWTNLVDISGITNVTDENISWNFSNKLSHINRRNV